MIKSQSVDLFITHAWRFHDDWNQLVRLLDDWDVHGWRNFSLPWFDPALMPNDPVGRQAIRTHLRGQILPAQAVIFLAGVYREPGTRKWLDFALETAREHGKPIIGVPAWGEQTMPPEMEALCETVIAWDVPTLLNTVADLQSNLNAV